MNYLKSVFLLLLLSNSISFFAQENFRHIWYTADDNTLPQNTISAIIKDKYGYIWLSTESGLAKFDGQVFKIYNTDNIDGLISNRIRLFAGKPDKDSIYLLNDSKQLLLINKRTVTNLKTKIPQPFKSIQDMLRYNYNPILSLSFTDDKEYIDIVAGNNLYIIGNDSIKLYNLKREKISDIIYKYPKKAQFYTIGNTLYLDSKNTAVKFTGLETSNIKYDRTFKESYYLFTNNQCGQSFIYSDKKLYYLKEKQNYIETILVSDDFDVPHNNIISFYYDEPNRVLYLGSSNKGLLVVKEQGFKHIDPILSHATGTDGVYYALENFGDSNILSSTGEVFNINGKSSTNNIAGFSDKYMLVIDNNGDIWTKNSRYLYRFTKKSNYKQYDHWKLDESIITLAKSPDGKIWVGTFNKGKEFRGAIYFLEPNDTKSSPQLFLKVKEAPASMAIADNKTIWTGTWKGLCKYDIKTKESFKIKDFPECQVRSLYIETTGEVWACSYGKGFFLYKDSVTTSFPTDKHKYLLTSHCITEDVNGFFWITTNKGLFQVKKQDLLNYANKKNTGIYYHYYNKNSGFPNNEFNGGCQPCSVYLNNETIFFPSMEGIVYFNTTEITPITPANPIYIDEITIDNTPVPTIEKISLDRDFTWINFVVSSPYYGEPYNENIEFMLKGPIQQEWTLLNEKSISFSTLPHGDYVLKTRKLNGFGSGWVYKDIKFTVEPAFWQTNWFIVIAIISGISLIYLIIKLRIRYIRYKNTLLENKVLIQTTQLQETITTLRKTKDDLSKQIENHKRLIKSITHDIKSPLKFLSITGRYIYNNIDTEKDSVKENLQAMYTSSFQLYHFVDNFLEYAKKTDISDDESAPYSLYRLGKEKILFFKNIAQLQKTELFNTIPKNYTTTINRHLLAIILHNLIDNATKNTFEGKITLNAQVSEHTLSISVEDTGKGMTKTDLEYYNNLLQGYIKPEEGSSGSKGMGLPMIAELLNILNGKVKILSQKNGGTTITITFNL